MIQKLMLNQQVHEVLVEKAEYNQINPNIHRDLFRLYIDIKRGSVFWFSRFQRTPIIIGSVKKVEERIDKHTVVQKYVMTGVVDCLSRMPEYLSLAIQKLIREAFGIKGRLYIVK